MDSQNKTYTTIDEYIAQFPPEIQARLVEMRAVIKATAPQVSEKISYQMPTFYLKGNLVHFAVHKTHIGFYPAPSSIVHFIDELAGYEYSKGAIRFLLNQPTPLDLVQRITAFRVEENLAQAAAKAKKG